MLIEESDASINSEDVLSTVPDGGSDSENDEQAQTGRPIAGVWTFFDRGIPKGGHSWAKCKACKKKWARGKPIDLESHLALNCDKVDKTIREFYSKIVANRTGSSQAVTANIVPGTNIESNIQIPKKRKKAVGQTSLSDFYESTTLTTERLDAINTSLIRAFIVCNLPFHLIMNPYFIDLLQQLRPAYKPPSRQVLSGRLLDSQVVKVNQKLYQLFENNKNLTLGNIY